MAMSYERISSFAEVEAIYNNTKPMRGRNKGKDVRPIADRSRDHERVKKISSNCYLLMNGGYYDDVFKWYFYHGSGRNAPNPTQAEMVALAPICWKRHKDGTETITIRNGIGNGAHVSHYSFLERMLPRTMRFIIQNGKQYVSANSGQHYLPKCMYVPRHVYEVDAIRSRWNSWMRVTDDGSSLTFFRDGDRFTLASSERDAPKPPRILVNKKQKAKYKDAMTGYLEWISAMAPMLQVDDWQYRSGMARQIREFHNESGYYHKIPPKLMRDIVMKQNHPLRLAMAVDFVSNYGTIRDIQSQADVKQVRTEFNRWINKHCGFTKTVKG